MKEKEKILRKKKFDQLHNKDNFTVIAERIGMIGLFL